MIVPDNGTSTLTAGTYGFNDVSIGTHAKLKVTGPAKIICTNFTGNMYGKLETDATDHFVVVGGSDPRPAGIATMQCGLDHNDTTMTEQVSLTTNFCASGLGPSSLSSSSSAMSLPCSATVTLDRQKIFENRIETAVAEISLGEVTAGAHEVSVATTRPALAYLNYLQNTNPVAYLQRFCLTAASNTLSFPYLKRDPNAELLVARIFSLAESNPQPFEVRMRLKSSALRGVGPFPDITFLERRARVTPGAPDGTYLVAANTARLDDGQPVFFPINPDLPPGPYQLELTVSSAAPRWLSLSRTTPGLAESANLLLQLRQN